VIFCIFEQGKTLSKLPEMEKNKASKKGSQSGASAGSRPNMISRRKVLKGLILVPVQWSLFLSAVRAQGNVRDLPWENNLKGGTDQWLPDLLPEDLYIPNRPVGTGQGIMPGRVSWVWNPSCTNPACANKPVTGANPAEKYDAWFMDNNTDQKILDKMLLAGLCSMTGKENVNDAWDAVFRFHNRKRGKGSVPYSKGEKIYIKLNRTTASGEIGPDYARPKEKLLPLACETSPHLVISMLRQLVNVAGVPQESIYVGDAMRNIYQDEYIKYHSEFPRVNYLSSMGATHGRITCGESKKDLIFYSDRKSVMGNAGSDKIYTVLEEAEYLINLAAMKGHGLAGITLCAKNHFGTQSRRSAAHLHPGLNTGGNRKGYGHYRVLVDLMGNKYTGDKNLFYILDALWSGTDWNGLPVKFLMPPFNNHWSSSLLLSLDPVAIESVAYDFLRTEFSYPEHTVAHIIDPGVDDYLHQAADSANWPAGIVYTPNGDGIPMPKSLGVHEHWNNPADKLYSRNLGKDSGIELVKIFQNG
jgi:hypothetical protein